MSQPVGSRVPRLVALGAMIGGAAILAVTALVLAQPTPAGAIPPNPDARRFCGGHATGAPTSGGAGPHIEWTAYYSLDAPDTVVAGNDAGSPRVSTAAKGVRISGACPPISPPPC